MILVNIIITVALASGMFSFLLISIVLLCSINKIFSRYEYQVAEWKDSAKIWLWTILTNIIIIGIGLMTGTTQLLFS